MEEPYTTFDTFTVGENLAPGEDPLAPVPTAPILARLPRLTAADQKSNRFDQPENGLIGVHDPTTSAPAKSPVFNGGNNPAATIRFDTVLTDNGFIKADPTEKDKPSATLDQAISPLEVPASNNQKEAPLYPIAEFDSWLLNLEATVMPYSRWIALAAVIAALGLTMILLRSSAPATLGDAPAPGNSATIDSLVTANEIASVPTPSTPSVPNLKTVKRLQSLKPSPEIITNAFATTATGPTGHETKPRARLTQRVQPIEPFRVRADETQRTEVAMRPPTAGYPRTATSGPLTPMTSQGSTLR